MVVTRECKLFSSVHNHMIFCDCELSVSCEEFCTHQYKKMRREESITKLFIMCRSSPLTPISNLKALPYKIILQCTFIYYSGVTM